METNVNEASSKYLNQAKSILRDSEKLIGTSSYLVGAASGNEIDQMVSMALSAAANLMAFARYFLVDGTVEKEKVQGNLDKAVKAAGKLTESKEATSVQETPELSDEDLYLDPYEAEYCPMELQGAIAIKEDASIMDLETELDDDPDAVMSLEPNGMPVRYENTEVDIDPLVAKMLRNNGDLIDPPEVFDAVKGASTSVEPEIEEPGEANVVDLDDKQRDQVIDAIADADDVVPAAPSAGIESTSISADAVSVDEDGVLPGQFSSKVSQLNAANSSVASNTGHNLDMLSRLMGII